MYQTAQTVHIFPPKQNTWQPPAWINLALWTPLGQHRPPGNPWWPHAQSTNLGIKEVIYTWQACMEAQLSWYKIHGVTHNDRVGWRFVVHGTCLFASLPSVGGSEGHGIPVSTSSTAAHFEWSHKNSSYIISTAPLGWHLGSHEHRRWTTSPHDT